ncbi:uncharacterized protein ACO6RY_10985 [Pungitius sinensis]
MAWSVGTQLPPHYRSKGTQKTVPCTDVGTSAEAGQASQPGLILSKRLRLEEDEDGRPEGSSSLDALCGSKLADVAKCLI